jgi:hypothetical protein
VISLQLYRMFRKYLKKGTYWQEDFSVNIIPTCFWLSVIVEQLVKFGEIERKLVIEQDSLIFYLNRSLADLFYQLCTIIFVWHNISYFFYSFILIL